MPNFHLNDLLTFLNLFQLSEMFFLISFLEPVPLHLDIVPM